MLVWLWVDSPHLSASLGLNLTCRLFYMSWLVFRCLPCESTPVPCLLNISVSSHSMFLSKVSNLFCVGWPHQIGNKRQRFCLCFDLSIIIFIYYIRHSLPSSTRMCDKVSCNVKLPVVKTPNYQIQFLQSCYEVNVWAPPLMLINKEIVLQDIFQAQNQKCKFSLFVSIET